MDLSELRRVLHPHVENLHSQCSHDTLLAMCDGLGLPSPPAIGTKRERMLAAFDTVSDGELADVAERFLERHPPDATTRNAVQDLLWSDWTVEIPKRFRREVARSLSVGDLYMDARQFDALLDRLWVLDDDPVELMFGGSERSLRSRIDRHVHRNPGDWSPEEVFNQLGAFDASDRRFALFIEGLASAEVRPDEASQRRFIQIVNEPLRGCGVEMHETDSDGGYPVFTLISNRGSAAKRPKNIIFASAIKPDLRFRDAVNNDIEIVTNADKVLIFDRPIGNDGLRWSDLQHWWSEMNGITDANDAKKTLYRRLRDSLPQNSPPQLALFENFYRGFGSAVPELPSLLPEVWLHWDPKTVRERGAQALLRFRMDFLLLLPHGIRVVVEVDGKHHFAHSDGRADSTRYAAMASADRELKLAGYEVFRFGAVELQGNDAGKIVNEFFRGLFKRFGVSIPAG